MEFYLFFYAPYYATPRRVVLWQEVCPKKCVCIKAPPAGGREVGAWSVKGITRDSFFILRQCIDIAQYRSQGGRKIVVILQSKNLNPVPALLFGPVQGLVGLFNKFIELGSMLTEDRDPEAHGHPYVAFRRIFDE